MSQWYQCPRCRAQVAFGGKFCANCGTPLNWQPNQVPSASSQFQYSGIENQQLTLTQNTSGQGRAADIPDEIKGWNWGAFLLTIFWGIGNRVWIALLFLIPIVHLVIWFYLGAKGNELAWRNKKWDSIEHFRKTQRKWMYAGIVFQIINFGLLFLFYYIDSKG